MESKKESKYTFSEQEMTLINPKSTFNINIGTQNKILSSKKSNINLKIQVFSGT